MLEAIFWIIASSMNTTLFLINKDFCNQLFYCIISAADLQLLTDGLILLLDSDLTFPGITF
jgi:hypothetical protein